MVIFGASGDLTQRMLIPSLLDLAEQRLIPPEFSVVGISRRELSDEDFRKKVEPTDVNATNWSTFSQGVFYMAGNHTEAETYKNLKAKLAKLDEERGTQGNRLFYLAVAPTDFVQILEQLSANDMLKPPSSADPENSWVRVIFEKPFGTDLDSATALNRNVTRLLPENQVYRIDHYLGKETVQNILTFRFANIMFEPVWNRRYIDHIQITAAETLGVGERAGYYNSSGALRDMVQNHLLQLLALVAMEPPVSDQDDSIRDEKVKVFKSLRQIAPEDVAKNAVRGQYREGFIDGKPVIGYRQEKNIPADSHTETYAAVRFWIDNWRWHDVPFYVRTGKRLARKTTEIAVVFKQVPHFMFTPRAGTASSPTCWC